MKLLLVLSSLVFVVSANSTLEADCEPQYKIYEDLTTNQKHIMCVQPITCVGAQELLPTADFSEIDKIAIVDAVNRLRSAVARGLWPGAPPAKQMAEVRWNDELEKIQQRLQKFCVYIYLRPKPKRYAPTAGYTPDGDNDYVLFASDHHNDRGKTADELFLNNLKYTMSNALPHQIYPDKLLNKDSSQYPIYAFFAADAKHIGCGFSELLFKPNSVPASKTFFACLLSPVPIAGNGGRPYYEFGEPDCPVPSLHYEGLCSTEERNKMEFKRLPCENETFARNHSYSYLCGDDQRFYDALESGFADLPFLYIRCEYEKYKIRFWIFVWMTVLLYVPLVLVGLGSCYRRALQEMQDIKIFLV